MLHSFTKANKVTSKPLSVAVTSSVVNSRSSYPLYEYHRIARKTYAYVAMDEATARACAASKQAQYERTFVSWRESSGALSNYKQRKCVADVQIGHEDGGLYRVDITVAEDQVQYVYGDEINKLGWLFVTDFDYDEDEPDGIYLQITSLALSGNICTGVYEKTIKGFLHTSSHFHIEKAAAKTGPWTAVETLSTADGSWTMSGTGLSPYYRLRWDDASSNIVESPTSSHSMTGTVSALQFYSSTCWRFAYSFDVPNFDRSKVIVKVTDASGTARDVTDECDVRNGMVYMASFTTASANFEVWCVYYDGQINTNHVSPPYNPASDVGSGDMVVTGCFEEGGLGSMRYDLNCLWTSSGTANPSARISSDGVNWSSVSATYNDNVLVVNVGTSDYPTYLKCFNDGIQMTGVITLPFRGGSGDQIWCNGIEARTVGTNTINVFYGTSISGVDTDNMLLQVSTDDGSTWEDCTSERLEGDLGIDSGIAVDGESRLFRFCYDAVLESDKIYSPTIRYPMA